MNFLKITALSCALLATSVGGSSLIAQNNKPVNLTSQLDSASYAIGQDIASSFKEQGLDLNLEALMQGMQDASKGTSRLSDEQIRAASQWLQQEAQSRQAAVSSKKSEANKVTGTAFLAGNIAQPGVVTLPNGLQYKVLREGAGESPKANNTVTVHYEGRLIDGTIFDSSYQRGQTIEFGVTQVIAGWTQALQLMKPGAKWQLFIPSDLAYGDRGAGEKIGPGAVLIFDVELISFK